MTLAGGLERGPSGPRSLFFRTQFNYYAANGPFYCGPQIPC